MINFTYGFELEGQFNENLEMLIRGEWKGDGSVSVGWPFQVIVNRSREFESPVYNDFESMITNLALFNSQHIEGQYGETGDIQQTGANHYWNKTCGLHLNIAIAGDNGANKLFSLATNFKFISGLQAEARKFCQHQKKRLVTDNYFCRDYEDKRQLKSDMRYGEKYRFVRFHPEKRLEFRFLSPCEHKVENVTKTIQLIEEYLNSDYELSVDVHPKDTEPVINKRVTTQIERIL